MTKDGKSIVLIGMPGVGKSTIDSGTGRNVVKGHYCNKGA